VETEEAVVDAEAEHGNPLTIAEVIINRLHIRVLIKIRSISAHLLLRVDILEAASVVPPFRRGLHQYLVWFDLLNELLCSLSKHGRLIGRTNKVDILAIEALGEMAQSRLEA